MIEDQRVHEMTIILSQPCQTIDPIDGHIDRVDVSRSSADGDTAIGIL